ncbi:MAG: hypothetical protein A4E63_00247 [Syntrophorhabdus sp. PtaU1.Bin050]|nr:MAG: hypothetical protein A4E63_00247 [Syntrophorhabdus sp. PtaU1.Bin050]
MDENSNDVIIVGERKYRSLANEPGEAYCFGCRSVSPRKELYYEDASDCCYHKGCIPGEGHEELMAAMEQNRKLRLKSKMLDVAGWIALCYAVICLFIVISSMNSFGDTWLLAALRIPFAVACFYGFSYSRTKTGRIVGIIGFIIIGIAVAPAFLNFVYLAVFASSVFGAARLYGPNRITREMLER